MGNIIFKILRFNVEKTERAFWQEFSVPFVEGSTVLDGLFHIQRRLDGSLAFRSSCRAGVCGSCAMHINGTYRLACETQVANLGDKVVVRPLSHLPIIKDLVSDFKEFWKRYKQIKPYLIPGTPASVRERIQTQDERKKLDVIIDCILCGACYASCTIAQTHSDYIGPASLLKVNRFVEDSRDKANEERLFLVGGTDGVFRCHTIYNCQKVCPKHIDVTGNIANLKMKIVKEIL
jgi:succinate dehydrogenase / fumarate reductase iron-sulfur subunit